MFHNKKISFKTIFKAFLNSGNYTYKDTAQQIGSDGIFSLSLNNTNVAEMDLPSVNLLPLIAKTGLMMFEAIVSQVDPNINFSKQVQNLIKMPQELVIAKLKQAHQLAKLSSGLTGTPDPGELNLPDPLTVPLIPISLTAFWAGILLTPLGAVYLPLNPIIESLTESDTSKDIKRRDMKKQIEAEPEADIPDLTKA